MMRIWTWGGDGLGLYYDYYWANCVCGRRLLLNNNYDYKCKYCSGYFYVEGCRDIFVLCV